MKRVSIGCCMIGLGMLSWTGLSAPAAAQHEDDYFVSVTGKGIYRLNPKTNEFESFAPWIGTPAYSYWNPINGNLMVPDITGAAIMKVTPEGDRSILAIADHLVFPTAFVMHEPSQRCFVADLNDNIIEVDPGGTQTVYSSNASGLYSNPAGLAVDFDGTMYIGNFTGGEILRIHPGSNTPHLLTDGEGLTAVIAGMDTDGSGNLFAVDAGTNAVVRVRTDTGEIDVFSADPRFDTLRDIAIIERGGHFKREHLVIASPFSHSIFAIDELGRVEVLLKAEDLDGFMQGVAVPSDTPKCLGTVVPMGEGTALSNGKVPRLNGIFSPCIGSGFSLEISNIREGSKGQVLLRESATNGMSVQVYADLPKGFHAWAGPQEKRRTVVRVPVPDEAALIGETFYFQVVVEDPDAPGQFAFSNSVEVTVGD